jgi:hypothetical protein
MKRTPRFQLNGVAEVTFGAVLAVLSLLSCAAACWMLADDLASRWGLASGFLLSVVMASLRVRHWLKLHRMHTRLGAGLCRFCGYDLRASPGRCPECGAVPNAKGAA